MDLFLHLFQLVEELLLGLGNLRLPGIVANLLGGRLLLRRVSSDGGVGLLVHGFHVGGSNTVLDESAEVLLVSLFILLLEAGHVVGHVDSEDVLTVNISVQLLALVVVSWEPLLGVGNVHSSVNSSLQGSENLGSCGSPGETHIKTGTEGSGSTILILDVEHGSVNVGVSLVDRVQLELLQSSSGQEKAGAVSCGVVGQTNLHSIPGQLVAVGSGDDDVPLESGVGDLAADVSVGASNDHPVLGGVVLVLVLDDETFAGIVVGPALPPPAELDLVPLEIGLVLDNFDERHFDLQVFSCRSESSNISL